MKRAFVLCLLVLLLPVHGWGKKKEIPPAPLPSQITQAKTVFLENGGGSDVAFDAFYQAMKEWGKYQIVGSPEQADLVIELKYWVEKNGSSTVPVTNTYTGQTTYYSSENRDPQMGMTIYDSKTKAVLWTTIDHRKITWRWEVNKEITKVANQLVDELKSRSE